MNENGTESLEALVSRLPTPLEARTDMSRNLGVDVFLKREDLVDDLGCGSKIRKLFHLVADALKQRATVLVTAGSTASNQCKAVAVIAARCGLRAHVVYGGDQQTRPATAQGNYLLTSLLGPTVTWCENTPWAEIESCLAAVAEDELRRGERPYVIPPGASAWPGLRGSIDLGQELANQLSAAGVVADDFVLPAGSGGTALGIKLAGEQRGLPWRVFATCIGEGAAILAPRVATLRAEAARHTGHAAVDDNLLILHERAQRGGYDQPQPKELDAVRTVARAYGLLFDPNYMIKAYLALQELIACGEIRRGRAVVLVHTGGHFGLFDVSSSYNDWHRHSFREWLSPMGAELSEESDGH